MKKKTKRKTKFCGFTVRTDQETVKLLDAICKDIGCSRSFLVNRIVRNSLENAKKEA